MRRCRADDACRPRGRVRWTSTGPPRWSLPKTNVHGELQRQGRISPSASPRRSSAPDRRSTRRASSSRPGTPPAGAKCGQTGTQPHLRRFGRLRPGRRTLAVEEKSADSACPGLPPSHDCIELDPGIYYGGWDIGSKVRVHLKPGIYVIAGGGIGIGSTGSLDSAVAAGSQPAPVLIFSTDNPVYKNSCPGAGSKKCQGNIDLTAQADLKLAGLIANQPCPPVTTTGGCPLGGMVIWHDGEASQGDNYSGQIDIEGGAKLIISGTIYAPKAHVDITGNVRPTVPRRCKPPRSRSSRGRGTWVAPETCACHTTRPSSTR